MKTRILPVAFSPFLMIMLIIPDVNATIIIWNFDYDLNWDAINPPESPYWATNGYWDVKGFQWGDPDTTYPSGFSCSVQNGVATIWVGDWEHDYDASPPLEAGTTVGAVRQGSVWDLATAPWYDQTSSQPYPLHFDGIPSITLSSCVRIDNESRTSVGWINWLFNPWFRVMSTYAGITKERKMVWDIVWGERKFYGLFSTAHTYIDGDEGLHVCMWLSL